MAPKGRGGKMASGNQHLVDINKVKQKLENRAALMSPGSHCRVGILVLGGSFSPVHRAHTAALEAAREAIEAQVGIPIVAGFLAASSEQYVKGKLGDQALSLDERNELCSLACAASDWIELFPWGWASCARVLHALSEELNHRLAWTGGVCWDIVGWTVAGADHAVRASLWKKNYPTVCIARGENETRLVRASATLSSEHFLLVDGGAEGSSNPDVSSTAIRTYMDAGEWDELAATGWLEPVVFQRLSGKRASPGKLLPAELHRKASHPAPAGFISQRRWHRPQNSTQSAEAILEEITDEIGHGIAGAFSGQAAKAKHATGLRPVVLIGIAGASGSGKSTLAKELADKLKSPVVAISSDWYFRTSDMPVKNGRRNPETPHGVDFKSLRTDLKSVVDTLRNAKKFPTKLLTSRAQKVVMSDDAIDRPEGVAVVVEGFLLFHDADLCEICDVQLWVEAERDTCLQRRYSRKPSQDFEKFQSMYNESVWPHYLMYRDQQLSNACQAVCLNGEDPRDVIVSSAMKHCLLALENSKLDSNSARAGFSTEDTCSRETKEEGGSAKSSQKPCSKDNKQIHREKTSKKNTRWKKQEQT